MLRHYDKLGILVPAYTNSETGYRYYTKSQLVILDLILVCTDLGIPLKQFNTYISDSGDFDIEKIIADGEKLAKVKLKALNNTVSMLKSAKAHLEIPQKQGGIYTRRIEKRYFFVRELADNTFEIKFYWEALSQILSQLASSDMSPLISQGTVTRYDEDGVKSFAYVEVDKPYKKTKNVITIPAGEYYCEVFQGNEELNAQQKYNKPYPKGTLVISTDVFNKKIKEGLLPFEIQVLV